MNPASDPRPPETDERAEIIFSEALAMAPADRSAFLSKACGSEETLRAEVEGLLEDHAHAGTFLCEEAPASRELGAEFGHSPAEQPGGWIGPYKLLEQIGEGGFGVVWVAGQEKPVRRRVALKIIKPGMDSREVIARFEQERQALAMMDHPNIAKVFDAGATPLGRPYFVMEWVRGVKITQYCDEARLSMNERLQLFIQVCHAVQHAHQKGIIHRDLKPSNILVTLHDGTPVPKVIDFGVAKAIQQQRLTDLTIYTQFEQMIGTPLYMSPEQAEMSGLDVDTRSDIYSLGVLLYELLTGRTPFDPETLMRRGLDEIRRVVREQEPQKPSTFVSTLAAELRTQAAQRRHTDDSRLAAQIRGDLDWIVMKALEKDRARRYETANGLAQDILRHLLSEPIQARPATQLYRFRRFAKRNKVAFGSGAGIAAALLVGIGVSAWQALRANAALSELRASAPAFAALARTLVAKDGFDEAIEKVDVAIKLRPEVVEYHLAKADLLQSQFRFKEAAAAYAEAFRLDPGEDRTRSNVALCNKLASKLSSETRLPRESLVELFTTMTQEQRPAAELMRVGRHLGEENKLLLSYWLDRLKDLPIPPDQPLEQRLTADKDGSLTMDLSHTEIADLHPLAGMPLATLDLSGCEKVVDLGPLLGMPLKSLVLDGTEVTDLSPLKNLKSLHELRLPGSKVVNLSPLRGLALRSLDLRGSLATDLAPLKGMALHTLKLAQSPVADLTPLKGMLLKLLDLSQTKVTDLSPLAGMPLESLDCTGIPAQDFSALERAGANLQHLSLQGTLIKDLSIFQEMPLKSLNLHSCTDAEGFESLGKVRSLEVLILPWLLLLSEPGFAAIDALPALRSVGYNDGRAVATKELFQNRFAEVLRERELFSSLLILSRNGSHTQAVEMFRDWLQKNPGRFEDEFPIASTLGTLLLAAGDKPGYQGICSEMLTRFRRRGQGDEVAARLCLISPDSGLPLTEVRRLMPHLALIRNTTPFRCWFVLSNGLLDYRAGRYAEAIELLANLESDRFPSAVASAAAAHSMALFRQGKIEEANAKLDDARALGTAAGPAGRLELLHDWLAAQLLLREASQLMTRELPPTQPQSR